MTKIQNPKRYDLEDGKLVFVKRAIGIMKNRINIA